MKRPSERDRKMRDFAEYAHWKADDFRHFVLTMVGLICSQSRFLPDKKMYDVLRHLSDLVFLMYSPRVTDSSIRDMKRSMQLFVDAYHARIGYSGCTWKFHIFQHFIELIEVHGSALFWDGYFRESVVGELKKFFTGTRNEDEQVVANFLLTHHGRRYFDKCQSSPRMKKFCEGLAPPFSGKSITANVGFTYKEKPVISADERQNVLSFFDSSFGDKEVRRVCRLKHGGVVFSSVRFIHRGMIDDSWVYFDKDTFGQIEDMFVLAGEEEKTFVVKLAKYRRVSLMDEDSSEGEELLFPIGQFPAESADEFEFVLVDFSTCLQKISVGTYEYYANGSMSTSVYLSVWPEHI